MQTDQFESVNKRTALPHIYPITILAIIALISYGVFYAPILYNDDWSYMIGRWYFGSLKWFDLAELRPLQKVPFVILYGIFGLNIHAFYAVFWTLNVLAAIQFYFLMLKLMPRNLPIAFSIAALVLVYPADFTHMWVSQIHIRLAIVFTLMYAHLLFVYKDSSRGAALWGSLLCLVFSFTVYEGQLGVAMTWCLLLVLAKRGDSWRSRLKLLLPLVVGLIFILWRSFGYSIVEIKDSYEYIDRLQLTPAVIIQRLVWGFQVLVWAWVEPLTHALVLNTGQAIGIILVTVLLCGILADVIASRIYRKHQNPYSIQHIDQLRRFLFMMIAGPVFIIAGYIPFLTVFQPTLIQSGSRLNGFALLGAAVTMVSLLTVVVLLLRHKQPQINFVVLAAMVPLIFLGMMVQARVQYDDRMAWEEQKQVWRELFALAPDLKAGTNVHFIFLDNEVQVSSLNRNGQRSPLFGSWDATVALNVLYGKKNDLRGDVTTNNLFSAEGIKNKYGAPTIPYDRALVVVYDGNSKRLRIVEDLQGENLVDFPVSSYTPYEHIIETPPNRGDWRWLVGDTPGR